MPKRKLALLLWVGIGLLTVGCRGNSSAVPCESLLLIDLEVATDGEGPDPVINEVLWAITGNGMAPMMGSIDTSAPNTTPSVEVFGLRPGTYTVLLEASSDDGKTSCQGSAMFDLVTGLTTEVAVLLRCSTGERFGAVRVNGKLNICPALTQAVVAPLQTSLGNIITVGSQAHDPDDGTIQYTWTANSGTFANPSAPDTFYTCEQTGNHQLTISVTDDDAKHCVDSWTVDITCVNDDAGGTGGAGGMGGTGATGGAGGMGGIGGTGATGGMGGVSGTGGTGATAGNGGSGGAGGIGGAGGTAATGGTGGMGGTGATGGAGGMGGIGGTGATGGMGGVGGTGGSGATGGMGGTGGTSGSGGIGGSGGMGGLGGTSGTSGSGGTGGTDGGICEITVSVTGP